MMARRAWLVAVGAIAGGAWGLDDQPAWVVFTGLMPIAWAYAPSRSLGYMIAAAYYLVASRGIPWGAGIFFAEEAPWWFSSALWVVAALLDALPWLICWRWRRSLFGVAVAVFGGILPPLGLIGWTHPVMSAGVLFPGLGFLGFGLLMVAWTMIARKFVPLLAPLMVVSIACNLSGLGNAAAPEAWAGVDTTFGRFRAAPGMRDFMADFMRLRQVKSIALDLEPSRVAVLPETVLGLYTDVTARELAETNATLRHKNSILLVGAVKMRGIGTGFENGLVVLGDPQTTWLRQRVPVPVGMWRPWAPDSVGADPWESGIGVVAGQRIATLICYEELIVWPGLVSLSQGPGILVGTANDWWARNTSIPAIQRQSLALWGRLFGIPLVSAVNF